MAWTPDDRLVCLAHFGINLLVPETLLRARIAKKVSICERYTGRLSSEHRKNILDTLTSSEWLLEKGFQDAFDGKRLDTPGKHALDVSIDALFPLWKAEGGFFIHHAGNIGLTTEFLNRLKHDEIPIVLCAAADAFKTTGRGIYLPKIELGFDHYYKI